MRAFKTKGFGKWATQEGVTDEALWTAVEELVQGNADALGGHVYKKRVALPGRGKRGGARTLLAFKQDENAFFLYGFAKNQRANIKTDELRALKLLAKELLGYSEQGINKAIKTGALIEVEDHGEATNEDKN